MNPLKTTWGTLLPALRKAYDVKEIEFKDWLDVLDEIQTPSEKKFSRMPALKILDFYKDMQAMERLPVDPGTGRAKHTSKTMRELEPITESLMSQWIKQWDF